MNADPFVREMMVLPNFYLAEGYYPMVRAMTEAEPSGNLLPNGSFEHIEGERLPGWGDALIGQRRGVALPARSGQWALRLASDSPAIWEGEEHDWVTVDVISEPVKVRPWDALRAAVWVQVPEQMQQTSRGAVLIERDAATHIRIDQRPDPMRPCTPICGISPERATSTSSGPNT
ncbi:MAG: hypothetical protein U9R79_09645, partial [Armatimonadota bacterium]|nr:hypothetical protein [Armatimonadota bacterium]